MKLLTREIKKKPKKIFNPHIFHLKIAIEKKNLENAKFNPLEIENAEQLQ